MDIRLLKSNEIDVRVQSVKKTSKGVGCILLLYKNARVDMNILDEVFGNMNWQRTHEVINGNLFCNIEVWDENKKCWIKKQDVGTESNTEKEKGQASDSFKRACFNLGIGRELYTSPFVWVNLNDGEWYVTQFNGKDKYNLSASVSFNVKTINYNEEREITFLEIEDNKKTVRYKLGNSTPATKKNTGNKAKNELSDERIEMMFIIANTHNITKENVIKGMKKYYGTENPKELTEAQYDELCSRLESSK